MGGGGTTLGPLLSGSVKEILRLRNIGRKAASTFPFLCCCRCRPLGIAVLLFSVRVILNGAIVGFANY